MGAKVGRPPKILHADRVKIREAWKRGRTPPPVSVKQLAHEYGVALMTIRRIVEYDDFEMEQRRKAEQ